jgi:branched-chain amino acid transport system substrate-binding protein
MNPARKLLLTLSRSTLVASALLASAAIAQPVKVGVIFPLSGGAGPQGQHLVKSIQSMAALINESGGVLGRQIVIEARDDESTPAVGVSRANELITAGVSVVIEGWNSPVTLAMQPVFSRAGVLDITAISKADPILSGEGNPLAVRLNSSNSLDGAVSRTTLPIASRPSASPS